METQIKQTEAIIILLAGLFMGAMSVATYYDINQLPIQKETNICQHVKDHIAYDDDADQVRRSIIELDKLIESGYCI